MRCHAIRRVANVRCSGVAGNGAGALRGGFKISTLAGRTIVGGTLALHDLSDRRAAYAARHARAIVDEIFLLEIAAFAVAADEIAQRAAALVDRGRKRRAHRVGEPLVTRQRHFSGGRGRADARAKEALGRIDIADTDDDVAGEQRLLHRDRAPARARMQERAGERRRERLDAEAREQRMRVDVAGLARVPQHRAEAARIAKAQHERVEDPVDVVVLRGGGRRAVGRQHAQRARHAEMHDEPARVGFEQQVLAAPLDAQHLALAQLLAEPRGHRPAQHGGTHVDACDAAPGDKGLDAPARNLDFRQLWHFLRVSDWIMTIVRVL
ncbi:protein of unknown function [Burkholderia multivorans]